MQPITLALKRWQLNLLFVTLGQVYNVVLCRLAIGYYEWKVMGNGKLPYFTRSDADEPLVFAGLFEIPRRTYDGYSCTLITMLAVESTGFVHPRMPVMVKRSQAGLWLRALSSETKELIRKPWLPNLNVYRVSTEVNKARKEGVALIKPLIEDE